MEIKDLGKKGIINTKPEPSILNRTALDATTDNQTESNILATMNELEDKEK